MERYGDWIEVIRSEIERDPTDSSLHAIFADLLLDAGREDEAHYYRWRSQNSRVVDRTEVSENPSLRYGIQLLPFVESFMVAPLGRWLRVSFDLTVTLFRRRSVAKGWLLYATLEDAEKDSARILRMFGEIPMQEGREGRIRLLNEALDQQPAHDLLKRVLGEALKEVDPLMSAYYEWAGKEGYYVGPSLRHPDRWCVFCHPAGVYTNPNDFMSRLKGEVEHSRYGVLGVYYSTRQEAERDVARVLGQLGVIKP